MWLANSDLPSGGVAPGSWPRLLGADVADLPKAVDAILQAVANSELTTDEGERMMALLERYPAFEK